MPLALGIRRTESWGTAEAEALTHPPTQPLQGACCLAEVPPPPVPPQSSG